MDELGHVHGELGIPAVSESQGLFHDCLRTALRPLRSANDAKPAKPRSHVPGSGAASIETASISPPTLSLVPAAWRPRTWSPATALIGTFSRIQANCVNPMTLWS